MMIDQEKFKKNKCIAIKVKGFEYYIWFYSEKVSVDDSCIFHGSSGWGNGGAMTNIDVNLDEITGVIYSSDLQYT